MKRSSDFRVRKSKLRTKKGLRLRTTKKLNNVNLRSVLMDRFLGNELKKFFNSLLGKLIIGSIALLILIVFVYTFFLSGNFKTQTVVLYEGDAVSANTEYQHLASQFRGKQLLTISKNDVLEVFLLNGVNLNGLRVEKNYPDTLVVYIDPLPTSFKVIFVTSTGNLLTENMFALNTAGKLTDLGKADDSTPLLEIVPLGLEDPKKGDTLLTPEQVEHFESIATEFEAELGMKTKKLRYLQIARELHLLNEREFWIWFDLTHDTSEQITKLKDGASELDFYVRDFHYIDLRVPGQGNKRIFYMEKN